jgi:hypothetical protein
MSAWEGATAVPNFEEWTMRGVRSGVGPAIAIQKGGILSVNREALDALGGAERVVLLFDREARLLGLRPATADEGHSYAVRQQGDTQSWLISGKSFLRAYDVPTDHARRYAATMQDGILVADLKAEATVPRKPRAKAVR